MKFFLIRHREKAEYKDDAALIKLTVKGYREADLRGQRWLKK